LFYYVNLIPAKTNDGCMEQESGLPAVFSHHRAYVSGPALETEHETPTFTQKPLHQHPADKSGFITCNLIITLLIPNKPRQFTIRRERFKIKLWVCAQIDKMGFSFSPDA